MLNVNALKLIDNKTAFVGDLANTVKAGFLEVGEWVLTDPKAIAIIEKDGGAGDPYTMIMELAALWKEEHSS